MVGLLYTGAAALLGAASVVLFSYAWMSLLGMAAAGILFLRGQISGGRCLLRAATDLAGFLGSGLTLAFCFQFYLAVLGRGGSQFEQLGYLAGCVPVVFRFLKDVPRRIDGLLDPERY